MQQTKTPSFLLALSFLLLLCVQTPSFGQTVNSDHSIASFTINSKLQPANYDRAQIAKTFTKYEIFEVSFAELRQRSMGFQKINIHLQLGDVVDWNLVLTNKDIRGKNYKETIRQNGVDQLTQNRRPSFTYKGHLEGNEKSKVRMNISDNFLNAYVQENGELVYIEPLYFTDANAPRNQYIVYRPEDVIRTGELGCSVSHMEEYFPSDQERPATSRNPNNDCIEVDLITACTYDYVELLGGITEANDRIIAITNLVEGLYEPFNMDYIIQEQFAPATLADDPFTLSVDAVDILNSFGAFAGPFFAEHDLGQIWTGRNISGCGLGANLIGCASGGACFETKYNVCENWNGNSDCLRALSAHEFGHNWGSGHDPQTEPYIMTPFIQCNATAFSPQSIQVIENFIQNATCLSSCCPEGEECGSNGPDLRIVMSGSDEDPPLWNFHNVQINLLNEGDEDATGIVVSAPKAESSVYEGGVIYFATQGTFDELTTQTWDVGTIPAGGSALLTLAYFRVSEVPLFQYAEVLTFNETDVDSTPGNGNGTTANEDDEGIYPNNEEDPCNPDLTPPDIFNCPTDIVATSPTATVNVNWTAPTASDDCELVSLNSTALPNSIFAEGTTTVTYTALDAGGNESTCSFLVTVIIDDIPPPPSCENNLLPDPGFEQGFGFGAWTTTDANAQVTSDAYNGDQAMELGNSSGNIRIYHNALPVTAGQDYTLSAYVKNSSSETPPFGWLEIKFLSATYQPLSQHTQIFTNPDYQLVSMTETAPAAATFIEVSLNKNAGDYIVKGDEWCLTAEGINPPDPCNPDITAPEFTFCPVDFTVTDLTAPVQVGFADPIATDDCSNVELAGNFESGDFFPEGTTTVEYEVIDAVGNASVCTFEVTVIVVDDPCNPDIIPPEVMGCPEDITVVSPDVPANAEWIPPSFTDECSTVDITATAQPGWVFGQGSTPVEYTAIDDSGNVSNCIFTVTIIIDDDPPGFCEDNLLTNSGFEQGFNSGWQAIGEASVSNDAYSGASAMLASGANEVRIIQGGPAIPGELYALSAYSKVSIGSGNGIVYIKFLTETWQPINTFSSSTNSTSYQIQSFEATAPENAAYYEVGLWKLPGDFQFLADEWCLTTGGINPPDPCNPDVTPPVFNNCPSLTIQKTTDVVPTVVNFTNPSATDNCSTPTISSNFSSGDLFPEGITNVSFEAVDQSGNLASCIFNVNVILDDGPPPNQPDLILDNLFSDLTVSAGTVMEYTFTLSNIGGADANDNFNIKAYFSEDPQLSNDDVFDGIVPTGFLSAGQTVENVLGASTVPDLPTGEYYLILKVDADDEIEESDELNNTIVRLITIENGPPLDLPDLRIAQISLPQSVLTGTSFQFDYTLQNTGSADAPGEFLIEVFLSPDAGLGTDDIFLGSIISASITAGQSSTFLATEQLPIVSPGGYFIIMKVDSNNEVAETNEENNLQLAPFTILENSNPEGYCDISSDFPWHEWISNVTLNDLNNDSDKSSYSDFTNLGPVTVTPGSTLDYSITATFSYFTFEEYLFMYIDWNGNGQFEPGEGGGGSFNAPAPANGATIQSSGSINVPPNVSLGSKRVRVILSRDLPITCGEIAFGEIEDYEIEVVASGAQLRQEQDRDAMFSVFPNPVNNELYLDISSDLPVQTVQVVDAYGHVKWTSGVDQRQGGDAYRRIKINTANWINGIYFVQVLGPFKPRTKRVMVQRTY